ncbi:hypothetical protein SeMB42_g00599 [Synchytrium endobioticum]|uniref:Elongator complex protein 1 n=1 Tax=Synchytrium endobioticum TaxID=286115 RepID=A0A507DQB1_9FUNG|nr:hypothetical protein SeLEV6574_g01264 [Synchytrium endobioticum]TPX53803.1 hypothetical protein SeMB42_g00599 [Synchytrium endobioticum]
MRSLTVLSELSGYGPSNIRTARPCYVTVDSKTTSWWSNGGGRIYQAVHDKQSDLLSISDAFELAPADDDPIVCLQYLPESQSLFVALASGDIGLILTKDDKLLPDHHEVVGTVDSGILCASWSPDGDLLAIVTGKWTLLLMSRDYDVISEAPIHVSQAGEDVPVSVGWGKKETQFHGSAGKAAALAEKTQVTNALSIDDDKLPRLSWRGDAQFLSCSVVDETNMTRVIRVYSKEGRLQFASEAVEGLEHVLSWRPSGNLIASTQRIRDRHDVVFFERNGLRHGEFELREPQSSKVRELAWNADSTILAIWIERVNESVITSVIQLWASMNFHWYLKQEIHALDQDLFCGFLWDPVSLYCLHLIQKSGLHRQIELTYDTFTSTSLDPSSPASVAVIDGKSLLITPFRHLNVPPPMAAFTITLPTNSVATSVSFGADHAGDDLAVLTCDGNVVLYQSQSVTRPVKEPQLLGIVKLPDTSKVAYRQVAWTSSTTVLVLGRHFETSRDILTRYKFDINNDSHELRSLEINIKSKHLRWMRLHHSISAGITAVQGIDGSCFQVPTESETLSTFRTCPKLPSPCNWISVLPLGEDHEVSMIGLTSRNKLYCNQNNISTECMSYTLHDEFLVVTTMTHTAMFYPLSADPSVFGTIPEWEEFNRRVERGSRCAVAVPGGIHLVLQMPRGNLETIAPRAFVLSAVRKSLDQLDFKTAFVNSRKHRIDLNLLYDHNPTQFMEHLKEFIVQVEDPDYLNLFLSSLKNEDVTVDMYRRLTPFNHPPPEVTAEKTNTVCDAIRNMLEMIDRKKYVQTFLTAFVRRNPPDLEAAIARIRQLRYEVSLEAAESALKYVVFLADANRLYDVALGIYDLQLVVMVAQHTLKDPREYLPFLAEIRKLAPHYQKFRIDDSLGKREKALKHLYTSGQDHWDECINYVKTHKLYRAALQVFEQDPDKLQVILTMYAEYLLGVMNYEDAAIILELCGRKAEALDAYRRSGRWPEAISLALQLSWSDQDIADMARDLAEELCQTQKIREAATLLLEHAKDVDSAIAMLLTGMFWFDAMRIAHVHKREDLIGQKIRPAIAEGASQMIEDLQEMTASAIKYETRLAVVRQKKQYRLAHPEMFQFDAHVIDDIQVADDTASLATTRLTGTSRGTRSTGRSSRKSSKRRESGVFSSKEGGAYEEEYLATMIGGLATKVNSLDGDVLTAVRALSLINHLSMARQLQTTYRNTLKTIQEVVANAFKGLPLGFETMGELRNWFEAGPVAPLDNRTVGLLQSAPVVLDFRTVGVSFL